MQSKLNSVIEKIDSEIEHKISSNKKMNENTYETFMHLKDKSKEIKLLMSKYSLNDRYLRLEEYLVNNGFSYNESSLKWYLFRNAYFNETAKIFFHIGVPFLVAFIVASLSHFYFSKSYTVIIFANTLIICTLILSTLFARNKE